MISRGAFLVTAIFSGLIFGTAIWFFLIFHISAPVLLQSCNTNSGAITNIESLTRVILALVLFAFPFLFKANITDFINSNWPKYNSPFSTQTLIDAIFAFTVFIAIFLVLENYYLSGAIMNYLSGVEIDRNMLSSCWLSEV